MNNKEFISELARRNNISFADAQRMMNTLLTTMGDSFQEGQSVQLPNFGLFEVKKKMERVFTNPTTGQRMLVPPKLTLGFKPNASLKEKIRNGGE
jgi:nucleoid DNA-binding protein